MSDPGVSALLAFIGGTALAALLVVPYIAWSYRKRGRFGPGHAVLAFGMLVYALALWTYTLLPVPDTTPEWCARNAVRVPQLDPLRFIADFQEERIGSGLGATLRNPALQQVVFNVALFVPMGMFGRHMLHRGLPTVVAMGALTSLFIEFTQLTAVWGLFACPYRLFDVDDLIANTAGAAIGYALAPLLRVVPGQRVEAPPGEPRPVTTGRRLLGMAVDVVSVTLLGGLLSVAANALWIYGFGAVTAPQQLHWLLNYALPVSLLLLVVPLAGNGATFGQRVVLINPVGPDGGKPGIGRMLVRFAVGSGGYFTLDALGLGLPAVALLLVSAVAAGWTRGHRGLSGAAAGLRLVDTRAANARTSLVAEDRRPAPEESP
ncbi:VanZ family protein [Actinokineospora sp. UTMC 2448]|uniref:VanZ family protein n=1 Tax=Actinokineospora sp. UTMC 2448 TaxID=2268449 RepID=UPI00216450F3|nr:VanZ family protein [Actinokineospora sp. UTMC 2448]UVS81083.1 VanZ like family protein [Actinokineospora sp. UTMC 2448]